MKFNALVLCSILLGCSQSQLQNPRTIASTDRIEYQPIEVDVTCAIACNGGSKKIVKHNRDIFYPLDAVNLSSNGPAEGPPPANSTLRLDDLSDRICLKAAIEKCGNAQEVNSVKPITLTSGSWKTSLPLDCDPKQGCTVSPFDHTMEGKVQYAFTSKLIPEMPTYTASFHGATSESCRRENSFNSCMGDCLSDQCSNDKTLRITLRTAEPYDRSLTPICMDEFDQYKKQISKGVREISCRIYVRKTLLESNERWLSCSALRLNLRNCK